MDSVNLSRQHAPFLHLFSAGGYQLEGAFEVAERRSIIVICIVFHFGGIKGQYDDCVSTYHQLVRIGDDAQSGRCRIRAVVSGLDHQRAHHGEGLDAENRYISFLVHPKQFLVWRYLQPGYSF